MTRAGVDCSSAADPAHTMPKAMPTPASATIAHRFRPMGFIDYAPFYVSQADPRAARKRTGKSPRLCSATRPLPNPFGAHRRGDGAATFDAINGGESGAERSH